MGCALGGQVQHARQIGGLVGAPSNVQLGNGAGEARSAFDSLPHTIKVWDEAMSAPRDGNVTPKTPELETELTIRRRNGDAVDALFPGGYDQMATAAVGLSCRPALDENGEPIQVPVVAAIGRVPKRGPGPHCDAIILPTVTIPMPDMTDIFDHNPTRSRRLCAGCRKKDGHLRFDAVGGAVNTVAAQQPAAGLATDSGPKGIPLTPEERLVWVYRELVHVAETDVTGSAGVIRMPADTLAPVVAPILAKVAA